MMRNARMVRYAAIWLLLLACSLPSFAQSPSPAANGAVSQDNEGFYRGWTLGTSFEGSTSGDGSVYDLGTSVGYNFSHHFGIDLGVPYYFVGTPSAVKTKNPGAVSGNGIGNIGADLKWVFQMKCRNWPEVARWSWRGTHKGDLGGIAPTGKQFTISGVNFARWTGCKKAKSGSNLQIFCLMDPAGRCPKRQHTQAPPSTTFPSDHFPTPLPRP